MPIPLTDVTGASYVFDPAARTITILGIATNLTLERISTIYNSTRHVTYWYGGTASGSVSGNVVTLNYDTTAHAANDRLLIGLHLPGLMATDLSAAGSLTAANQTVVMPIAGVGNGLIQLSGTWVGSVAMEASLDNFTTYTTLNTTQSGGLAPNTTPLSANGFYRVLGITNYNQIRARCSAYTSGTITVTLKASTSGGIQPVVSTNALGFLATVSQGGTWNIGDVTGTVSLPTGAATESTLTTINGKIPSSLTVTGGRLQVELPSGGTGLTNAELRASAVPVSLSSVPSHAVTNTGTFAVQAAQNGTWNVTNVSGTVSLPTGASTEATLSTLNGKIPGSLTVTAGRLQVELPSGGTGLTDTELRATAVPVSLASVPSHAVTNAGTFAVQVTSAPTTAVTGTFFQATQPVSLASVPSHAVTNAGTFAVQVTSAPTTAVTGTFFQATQPVSGTVTANAGSGTFAVSAASLPLPSGASTEATLALIKAKTDNIDVLLSTRTKPADTQVVSLASTTLTGTSAVSLASLPVLSTGSNVIGAVTQSGAWTVGLPSGASTAAKQPALGIAGTASADVLTVQGIASMTALKVDGSAVTQPVSGTFFQATQPVSIESMPSTPVTGTFFQATQPISGTVTANAGSGTFAVSGPITDAQLRASAVPVSLISTTLTGTSAVSVASLPLPSGAATEATIAAQSNSNTTTGDTGAKTATFNGATQTNLVARGASVLLNIGTVTGTTPSMTVKFQGSADGGTTWYDIPNAVTAAITASTTRLITVYPGATVAANVTISYPLPRIWRLVYTITGTTPSFTITNVQVAYIL